MKKVAVFLCLALSLAVSIPRVTAQEKPAWAPYPNVVGVWTGKAYFMIPKGGVGRYSMKTGALYDPESDAAFFKRLKENLPKNIEVI